MKTNKKKETSFKIEEKGIYMTDMGDLIKVININEKEDKIHFYNISTNANIYLSFSRIVKNQKFIKRIR